MKLKRIISLILCGLLTFGGVAESTVAVMAAEKRTSSTVKETAPKESELGGNGGFEKGQIITTFSDDPSLINSNSRAAEIAINAKNFPDAKFRSGVRGTFDKNNNGKLSTKERNAVTTINANNIIDIKNFKGIEYFPNLTQFQYTSRKLAKLDLSKNKNLVLVLVYNNKLTSLKLPASIEYLEAQNNNLKSVSGLDKCTYIEGIYLHDNAFVTLPNMSSFAYIRGLDLKKNYLSASEMIKKLPLNALLTPGWLTAQVNGQRKLAKATKLSVANAGSKKLKVSWKKAPAASGYEVWMATSKKGSYKLIKKTTGSSFTHKKLKKNKTYYYKIRSYKKISGETIYSNWTSYKSKKAK
jgi:Fibronectin type 3 domain-containing protein